MFKSLIALFKRPQEPKTELVTQPQQPAPKVWVKTQIPTKNQRILALLKQGMPVQRIAKEVRCSMGHVYFVKRKIKDQDLQ